MNLPVPERERVQFIIAGKAIYVEVTAHLLHYIGDRIKVAENGCWIWMKKTSQMSYQHPELGQVTIQIPTLMYKIYNGSIKHNTYMERTCEDWECIRPSHLVAGTREGKSPRRAGQWVDVPMDRRTLKPWEISSLGLASTLDPKRNLHLTGEL